MKWRKHNNEKRTSIFKRLIFTGFATVIISYIMVAVFLLGMIYSSARESNLRTIEDKKQLLLSNAQRISNYSLNLFSSTWTPQIREYQQTLEIISSSTDTGIIIFDKSGTVITVAGLDFDKYIGSYLSGEYIDDILLYGETVSNEDDIDVFKDSENLLTLGVPISNNKIYGGVLICTTANVVNNNYSRFVNQFLISVGISIVLTLILFYFIAQKITKPIKQIDETVTQFSKGRFDLRVECNTKDELGSLSENINNMANSIENLEKMRSDFVSNVSHELRTPMTSITGFVEGILDGTIPQDKHEEYLQIVLDESKRLSRLVNELLSISRLESGTFKIEKQSFDICKLTRYTIIKFENQIVEKNLNVELEIPDEDVFVFADSDAITQVMTNLISNAIKFANYNGEIKIKIYYSNNKVNVEIFNTGEGINNDKLKYIWDRFYKADDSRNLNPEGIGLGLYIVKSIINKSDEKIFAESKEGEYTKFTFTLTKN